MYPHMVPGSGGGSTESAKLSAEPFGGFSFPKRLSDGRRKPLRDGSGFPLRHIALAKRSTHAGSVLGGREGVPLSLHSEPRMRMRQYRVGQALCRGVAGFSVDLPATPPFLNAPYESGEPDAISWSTLCGRGLVLYLSVTWNEIAPKTLFLVTVP